MIEFEVKEEWLKLIKKQEAELAFESFDNDDAAQVGQRIAALARDKYKGAVAICIEVDNNVVFSYMMQGTTLENKLWMHRKINVSKITKTSSLLACVEERYSGKRWELKSRPDSFAVCGGCWPVQMKEGEPYAYIAVSGLEHYLDHQIIVDAVADFIGRKTETISI